MLIERIASLIDFSGIVIAHGVNAKGKMGAGVARMIKEKYPVVFEEYSKWFQSGLLKPGEIQVVDVSEQRKVINMCTQENYGREPIKYAKIEDIRSCLEKGVDYLNKRGIKEFAMPRIGCNMAGLDWETEVRPLVLEFAQDIDIVICHLPSGEYKV